MLFCSEPLIETCSSMEEEVFFPRNHQNEKFLLDPIIVPMETSSWTQTTLPPSGTPLSIFEFAGLSPEQQKQWLEACSDKKQTTTQRKVPLSRNDACEQSCKTDETDSITSLSSRSGDAQSPSGVQKRSIFGPYWAKTGEKTVEKNTHDPDVCTAPGSTTTLRILQEASKISMSPMTTDRCCGGDERVLRPARLHQDETRIASLSEQPPRLTPQRRAVSTSAISILKNKQGEQQEQEGGEGRRRRRRSSSFSVSFDSKVNVVLVFQDKPPYHTRRIPPWWASWLSGTCTGGEFDVNVIEKLAPVRS